jgi:hypothetical protein
VPARKVIPVRRHERARPALQRSWRALRRGYAIATPVVRRRAVALARLTAAEIRERNLQHAAPAIGRAHRTANRYTFALNSPTREG